MGRRAKLLPAVLLLGGLAALVTGPRLGGGGWMLGLATPPSAGLEQRNRSPDTGPTLGKGIVVTRHSRPPPAITATDATDAARDEAPLMLCIMAGGEGHERKVAAQLATFADDHTWFATRSPLATQRTILPDEDVEQGGRATLHLKTLRLFHNITHTPAFLEGYRFVMKADDDTYVNLPRVRALLAELDPEVPLFLGSTRFGLQPLAGSQAQLTRMVQRGEFFREAAKHSMCHGGSGYVVSRGLLRLLRPHLQRCELVPPPTAMEDAKMAFCISQFTGIQCVGLQDDPAGFDVLRNARAGPAGLAAATAMAAEKPTSFRMGSTFHRLDPESIRQVHALQQEAAGAAGTATEMAVATATRRWFIAHLLKFTVTWNCTVALAARNDESQVSPTCVNAICQQRALKSTPRLATSLLVSGKPAWRQIEPTWLVQRFGSRPGRHRVGNAAVVRRIRLPGRLLGRRLLAVFADPDAAQGPGSLQERLARMVGSLTTAGVDLVEDVMVVLFSLDGDAARWDAAGRMPGVAAVVTGHVELATDPTREVKVRHFAMLAGFLLDNPTAFVESMHCPVDTHFDCDPFKTIGRRLGVAVFATHRAHVLLMSNPTSPGLVKREFGSCSLAEQVDPVWVGPAALDSNVVLGDPASHAEALVATVEHYDGVVRDRLQALCSADQAFSRVIWLRAVARRVPVTIYVDSRTSAVWLNRTAGAGNGNYVIGHK